MLSKAVDEYPESYELLYDRAMAAERVNKLDVLEKPTCASVIQMKPDYAHAYNALGYTLADRTNRLAEAKELIDKAYKLAPDDPFILDSLGWVYFRLGNKPGSAQVPADRLQLALRSGDRRAPGRSAVERAASTTRRRRSGARRSSRIPATRRCSR